MQFFTKTGITLVPMDQITKFLCLNASTCICLSAGISKSVKNKIYKLVSREQTIFSALKCPYFGLKINKTAFSPKFPRVSFHFLLFWLCLYVDYHFPLTEHQGHVRAGGHISQAPWGGPAEKMILFLVVFKIYFRPFWVILVKKNWVKLKKCPNNGGEGGQTGV